MYMKKYIDIKHLAKIMNKSVMFIPITWRSVPRSGTLGRPYVHIAVRKMTKPTDKPALTRSLGGEDGIVYGAKDRH